MTELLAPAGNMEALRAAVSNGCDAVYLGLEKFGARAYSDNFTIDSLAEAIRYAHLRDVKIYVTMNTIVFEDEISDMRQQLDALNGIGVDGIIVQDLAVFDYVTANFADMEVHCSTQMGVDDLEGTMLLKEMGADRVVLAREVDLADVKKIRKAAKIPIEVFVHGALCFCHSGQCYMSALIGRRSGNRGLCAQPCRLQYSLGGRMDDHPLSLKDNCLVDQIRRLEEVGVASLKIEGRMKRPEYTGIVTGVYAKAIREQRNPDKEEMELLEKTFSRQGFTQGYFIGDKLDMFGVRSEPDKDADKIFATARKQYAEGEMRRVPVHFYTVLEKGEHIKAIAFDDDGHKAIATGPVPERAKRQGLTEQYLTEQMFKTGGTPYNCIENKAKAEPGLYLPASEINELRRKLIAQLSAEREKAPERRTLRIPAPPVNVPAISDPARIYQVRTAEQLTPELAELKPDYIYFPAMELAENFDPLRPFIDNGARPVAVMPRVITDDQSREVYAALEKLFDYGVNEALTGNLGHVFIARQAGMKVRGDFGLNAFNSYTLRVLQDAGFISATASFELRLAQIKAMAKPIDTELIIYGRLPLMVSDQCIIRQSAGRCNCQTPGQLSDRMGSVFPVVKEFGCRNVIYNAHKLYLADKRDDLYALGLWGLRMLFTTESPRECVEVAKGYLGLTDYKPNVLTRGLYYRGVD